jgi:hypothetical protein
MEDNQKGVKLTSFDLDCDIEDFIEVFWSTPEFHSSFVTLSFDEKVLAVSEWIEEEEDNNNKNNDDNVKVISYTRLINTNHPLPISLPWLPVYVTNQLKQTIQVSYNFSKNNNNISNISETRNFFKLEIYEKSVIDGIPWVQPKVWTKYIVTEYPNEEKISIKVYLWFEDQNNSSFDVISPLVEIHSSNELSKYFTLWREKALETLKSNKINKSSSNINDEILSNTKKYLKKILDVLDELDTIEFEQDNPSPRSSPRSSPRRRRNSQQIEPDVASHIHLLNLFFALSVLVLFAKGIDSTLRVAISMFLRKVEKITILYYFVRITGSILIGSISGIFCNYLKRKLHNENINIVQSTESNEGEKMITSNQLSNQITIIEAEAENTSYHINNVNPKPHPLKDTIDVILYPVQFFASLHNTPGEKSENATNNNDTPIKYVMVSESLIPLNDEKAN